MRLLEPSQKKKIHQEHRNQRKITPLAQGVPELLFARAWVQGKYSYTHTGIVPVTVFGHYWTDDPGLDETDFFILFSWNDPRYLGGWASWSPVVPSDPYSSLIRGTGLGKVSLGVVLWKIPVLFDLSISREEKGNACTSCLTSEKFLKDMHRLK